MGESDRAPGRSGPEPAPGRSGPELRRRSPLEHYADRLAEASGAGVRVAEVPFLTQLDVRVGVKSAAFDQVAGVLGFPLPAEPNTIAGDLALWLGPDEWLLVGDPELEPRLVAALAGEGAVVDVSGQRTVVELAGPHATEVLAKGCALDLHPRAFGVGQCAQTSYARAPVILVPRPDGACWIFVRASYAEYVAEYLIDAATEYR
jgi:sarcosine oxidase subunit gamma